MTCVGMAKAAPLAQRLRHGSSSRATVVAFLPRVQPQKSSTYRATRTSSSYPADCQNPPPRDGLSPPGLTRRMHVAAANAARTRPAKLRAHPPVPQYRKHCYAAEYRTAIRPPCAVSVKLAVWYRAGVLAFVGSVTLDPTRGHIGAGLSVLSVDPDSGALALRQQLYDLHSPTYLALHARLPLLYAGERYWPPMGAASPGTGAIATLAIAEDGTLGAVGSQPTGGALPT